MTTRGGGIRRSQGPLGRPAGSRGANDEIPTATRKENRMSRGRYGGSGVRRWTLLTLLAALVLTLAAVAAGCGGDDDEASTTDTGAASGDTGGSAGGEAIKIGHLS